MTSINHVVHAGGVYLFADTASVGVGRTLVEFGSKIRTYENLGLMTGGNVAGGEMVAKCLPDGCDYDHAAFVLPHALRKWLSVAHEQRVADPDVLILIAGWSEKMTRWAGAAVSTFDVSGREGLIVRDCGVHLSPVMKAGGVGQLSGDETLANVLALGIDEFARRVLNARRLAEASTDGVCLALLLDATLSRPMRKSGSGCSNSVGQRHICSRPGAIVTVAEITRPSRRSL